MPKKITHIPFPGSSGQTPTGAMQFQDDWPGLFIRGDDALSLVRYLRAFLTLPPDSLPKTLWGAAHDFERLADIIEHDVLVRAEDHSDCTPDA